MSNSSDLDQDQGSVGPDLDPNCLQRLSAKDKIGCRQGKSKRFYHLQNRRNVLYPSSSVTRQNVSRIYGNVTETTTAVTGPTRVAATAGIVKKGT